MLPGTFNFIYEKFKNLYYTFSFQFFVSFWVFQKHVKMCKRFIGGGMDTYEE